MRFIEVDLDGVAVRAKLNEEKAPKMCAALWDALPFEGRAVHAQGSGEMFRMLDPAPLGELELEARAIFQYPGLIVYHPRIKEIAFCYGSARFAGGPADVGGIAEIEGNIADFGAKAATLQFAGTKPIRFRRAADQSTPFRVATHVGRKIEVEFGGAKQVATLLEDMSPAAAASLAKLLPLEGKASNDTFGGQITRFWPANGRRIELEVGARDRKDYAVTGLWPGFVYYYPAGSGIYICYGTGVYIGGPWWTAVVTPIARFDGDWGAVRAQAEAQLTEGEKPMAFRLR